jgi:hypothetical protein
MRPACLITAILALSIMPLSGLYAGSISKGGDDRAIEFKSLEKDAIKAIKKERRHLPFEADTKSFKEKIETVIVHTETDPTIFFVDGHLKDAISVPDKNTILLFDRAWDHISSRAKKVALVVHEVGIQLGWEDNNQYPLSSLIMARLLKKEEAEPVSIEELIASIKRIDETLSSAEVSVIRNEMEINRLSAEAERLKKEGDRLYAEYQAQRKEFEEQMARSNEELERQLTNLDPCLSRKAGVGTYCDCVYDNFDKVMEGITKEEQYAHYSHAAFNEPASPASDSYQQKYDVNVIKVCGEAPNPAVKEPQRVLDRLALPIEVDVDTLGEQK